MTRNVSVEECAAWRQLVRDGTAKDDIAPNVVFSEKTVERHVRDGNCCTHDTAGLTGVEPPDIVLTAAGKEYDTMTRSAALDAVTEALRRRLQRNVGDSVYCSTGTIADDEPIANIAANRVSRALTSIAEMGQHDGIAVERTNPDAKRCRWAVRFADEVTANASD